MELAHKLLVSRQVLDFRYWITWSDRFHIAPKGCKSFHSVCQNKPSLRRIDLGPKVGSLDFYTDPVMFIPYFSKRFMSRSEGLPIG